MIQGAYIMDKNSTNQLFDKWCKKLRVVPAWDVKIEYVEDPTWRKSGDIKIDCDDRTAIVMLNAVSPKQKNIEGVIVHELLHLKMYPLDQVTESLITSNFKEGTPEWDFAYTQFFTALEQTVAELTKCYLLEFGDTKDISFGRCRSLKSYNELFDGLKNL